MNNRDCIKNISDIMLCIQSIIKSRFGKKVKIIYTKGRYHSAYVSFYKSPWVCQFYCEDKANKYMLYLLRNERVIRRDVILKKEEIEHFYTKLMHFFRYI